jgi:enoyl-CoA hydratase/carnithine racemase
MLENTVLWQEWKNWDTLLLQTHPEYPEIALLTLNRPENVNSVNLQMISDLYNCFEFLETAYDCRVVIFNGAGRMFCAGLDLMEDPLKSTEEHDFNNFPDAPKQIFQRQKHSSEVIVKLRRIPQPVVAAVHHAAAGFGMAFTNASDIVVASKKTKFLNSFIKIGFGGGDMGSSYFLPRILGFHKSAEMLYTGRELWAEEAHQHGYVNILVEEHGDVLPKAVEFTVEHLLTKSPMGLRMTKEILNYNMDAAGVEQAIRFEDRNQALTGLSTDLGEGFASFHEKRKPKYGSR